MKSWIGVYQSMLSILAVPIKVNVITYIGGVTMACGRKGGKKR